MMTAEIVRDSGDLLNFEPTDNMIKEAILVKSRYQKVSTPEYENVDPLPSILVRQCKKDEVMYSRKTKRTKYVNKNVLSNKTTMLREVAMQQDTACGARSGRRGQLAALGQFAWQFSLDRRGSNSNQRVSTRAQRT